MLVNMKYLNIIVFGLLKTTPKSAKKKNKKNNEGSKL